MRSVRIVRWCLALAGLIAPAAAGAQNEAWEFDGAIEAIAIASDLDLDQGDGIDSSGVGARARFGATYNASDRTSLRAEVEGRVFEFEDTNRDRLDTAIGRLHLDHQLTETLALRLYARRFENISLLEALQADQTSLGGRIQWERGNHRLRFTGEYRTREYDTRIGGEGEGGRVAAQYNRRFGAYHWLRFDLAADRNDSEDEPRRSYDRRIARVAYSHPVGKRVRLRPRLEYREWDYDSRIARSEPTGALREDSYIAPGVELAWGRATRGVYGEFDVEYRIRESNDERFDDNALRAGVRLGYRF